ncbi:hypothetical protein ABI59_15380 [Acidobacteria bacterium Mor1]|nr:hypothetical protein ABI59_15380 [Acidobacteria bacterium Mor1]
MTTRGTSVLETAASWNAEGRKTAIATVVRTWRSSPRPLGSRMVVDADGRFEGSVSGGCVESAVIQECGEFLQDGKPRTLKYGVTSEMAWEVGLPCGGTIEVFVGPGHGETFEAILEAHRSRGLIGLVTDLEGGAQRTVDPESPGDDGEAAVRQFFERYRYQDVHEILEQEGGRRFVELLGPPLRLAIVGATHLGQCLASLAAAAGIESAVIDPREAFATPERFPHSSIIGNFPDVGLRGLMLDRRTAVVVLSHDAKIDDPALSTALGSDVFYIGALGSRKNQGARRARLRAAGIAPAEIDRIHGPVGLDIGALTAEEIAVSILAEVVERWRSVEG